MFQLILYQPEIPPNTGNVIRLCANSGATLHLVKPLGFDIASPRVRRAGMDYEELASVRVHASLDACLAELGAARLFSIETSGTLVYSEARFQPGDALIFGPETRGLPTDVLERVPPEQQLRVPMRPGNRSINLSNTVALVVYEAWRQNGFAGGSGRGFRIGPSKPLVRSRTLKTRAGASRARHPGARVIQRTTGLCRLQWSHRTAWRKPSAQHYSCRANGVGCGLMAGASDSVVNASTLQPV